MKTIQEKETVAKSLLDKFSKAGADDVIVNVVEGNSLQIKFVNSRIATTLGTNWVQADVFTAVGKKLVATTIRDFSENAVYDAVSRIMKFSRATTPNEDYQGIAEGPFKYKDVPDAYDKRIAELDEKSVDLTEAALNAAAANGSKRSAGVLESAESSSYLLTSNNVEATDAGTQIYFSLRAFVDKYASGHCVTNSRVLGKFDPEKTAIKAAEIAKDAVNPAQGAEGTYDVLFEPLPFSNMLDRVGDAASMFNVESQMSCFADRLGQKVASSDVTVTDDGSLENGYNSRKFDAEGVPTRKNFIIKDGVLNSYLHNTSSAKRYNVETTANAGLITPTPFNLAINNGKVNKEEIISGIKKGLIITNVWYTRFQNYASGDFSTIPRDGMFLVENGKISGPVKELRINDNLMRLLENISAVGNKPEQVFGWETDIPVTTPCVLVKGVHLTRSVA